MNRLLILLLSCIMVSVSALDIGQSTIDVIYGGKRLNMPNDSFSIADNGTVRSSDKQNIASERLCRGALVAPGWVLTAAHCVQDFYATELYIAGSKALSASGSDKPEEYYYQVLDIILHPDYDAVSLQADLAMLRLSNGRSAANPDFKFGWKTAVENATNNEQFDSLQIYSGHLSMSELYTVQGDNTDQKWQLLSYDQCQSAIQSAWQSRGLVTEDSLIESDQICLLAVSAEYATCHGDSGSPVFLKTDAGFYIAGLVSWNYQCDNPEFPTALVDLEPHKDWIYKMVNSPYVRSAVELGNVPVGKNIYTSIDVYNPEYMTYELYLDFPGSSDSYIEVIGNSCRIGSSPICKIEIQLVAYQSGALDETLYLSSSNGGFKKQVQLTATANRPLATSIIDKDVQIEWFSNSRNSWQVYDNQVESALGSVQSLQPEKLLGLIKSTSEKLFRFKRMDACANSENCDDYHLLLNKRQLETGVDNSWTVQLLPNVTYALELVRQTQSSLTKTQPNEPRLDVSKFKMTSERAVERQTSSQSKEQGGALWCFWLIGLILLVKRKKPAKKLAS